MPPADLVRALPGLAALALFPGWLVAAAMLPRRRRWEWVAIAPGMSAGLWGVVGLAYHDTHIPFRAATAVPLLVPLGLLAVVRVRSARATGPTGGARSTPGAALMVALAVGLITAGLAVAHLHNLPLPPDNDSPVHAEVAAAIVRDHDTLPTIAEPVDASAWYRIRTGVEATVALITETGGPPVQSVLIPIALLSVLILPVSLGVLALEATGSSAVATLAPIAGMVVGFSSLNVGFGFEPAIVDATLVVPLVVATMRLIDERSVREQCALMAASVAAIWAIHGLEVITALVISGALVTARVRTLDRARIAALAAGGAAAAAGAVAVTLLTRPPKVPEPVAFTGATGTSETATYFNGVHVYGGLDALEATVRATLPTAAIVWAVVAIAALVWSRRLGWALLAQGALVACAVDVLSLGLLDKVWRAVYPWSELKRLFTMEYWTVGLILAAGTVALVEGLEGRWRLARPARMAAAGLVALSAGLSGLQRDNSFLNDLLVHRDVVRSADIAVMTDLSRRLRAGAVILTNDLDDAGMWIDVLTPQVTLWSKPFLAAHPVEQRVDALAAACADPSAAAQAVAGTDGVFVGSKKRNEMGAPWTVSCLTRVPNLHLVTEQDGAAGFVVIG